ncbi:DUF1093 domain-containing protein [Bacillus cereus group sp. Bc222]|uniref:DUF1093 domain-containing protein n=1 Tax=Bacillus cereus group sp. Bc222 TaxID=3018111 RepID=UPI0022E4F786|nr:DUF1093 domain-containing protein [Bacillus cereus group sp. Bc222]MDA2241141.1 DUF1093 domain-containing protein [Bacillus cereus group sp. Bc222]
MKKGLCLLILTLVFSISLAGCETWDRYSPFASKTDVYGVVTTEPKIDAKAKENGVTSYSYDLIGYDKELNKVDLGFGSRTKHPIGTYIKAVKKGSDTRMHDIEVVKKEGIPENVVNKLNGSQK